MEQLDKSGPWGFTQVNDNILIVRHAGGQELTLAASEIADLIVGLLANNLGEQPKFLATSAVAKLFNVTNSTVQRWHKEGRIPGAIQVADTGRPPLHGVPEGVLPLIEKPKLGNPAFYSRNQE